MPLPNTSALNVHRRELLQDIEDHRERLLREIQEHRDEVMRQINTETTIIGHIPADILTNIFFMTLPPLIAFDDLIAYNATDKLSSIALQRDKDKDEDLRAISQVCRMWRELTLQTPVLWTRVKGFRSTWDRLKQYRSRGAPLRLLCGPTFKDTFLYSGAKVPSIHTLEIAPPQYQFNSSVMINSLNDKVQQQTKMLIHNAAMRNFVVTLPHRGNEIPLSISIPERQESPQSLRTVLLYRCSTDFSLPCFKRVTHLLVSNPAEIYRWPSIPNTEQLRSSYSSWEQWLHMLHNMPQLMRLHIRSAVKSSSNRGSTQASVQKVVLPHLVDLSLIAGIGDGIGKLLCGISPQRACSLYISDSDSRYDDEESENLLKGLKAWFALFPDPHPNPGVVSLMPMEDRFMISNICQSNLDTGTLGLRFQVVYRWPKRDFLHALLPTVSPYIINATTLKIISTKWDHGFDHSAIPDVTLKNIRNLVLMEYGLSWRRYKKRGRKLPFVHFSREITRGRLNLDFPSIASLPALEEIHYLPGSPLELGNGTNLLFKMSDFISRHLRICQ
ncbi:hypothetical protein BJ165DRAFT_1487765 [Panaeolus papilionaceus]|nr:hypothetical protein BJ165DRAFT_1487765 [Panaeolus papilionaceus]